MLLLRIVKKYQISAVALLGLSGAVVGCAGIGNVRQLAAVSLESPDLSATPSVLARVDGADPLSNSDDWGEQKKSLQELILDRQYGQLPDHFQSRAKEIQVVDSLAYDGQATVEVIPLQLEIGFGDGPIFEREIRVVVARPNSATGPVPVILKMEFCPFNEAYQIENLPDGRAEFIVPTSLIPSDQLPASLQDLTELPLIADDTCLTDGGSVADRIINSSLGSYHKTPPVREAIERGYAFASIYVVDLIVDDAITGSAQLDHIAGQDKNRRWGALAAWAFQYSRAVDVLDAHPDLDSQRQAVYGHSRFGKAALLAAALDERIDLTIAHQTGRLGASLTRSPVGEPIGELVTKFPHWVSPEFNQAALGGDIDLPFDQHHILSLLAPRPLLIGHAVRDRWSDPQSAFAAAQGATPVYELLGSSGLTAERLDDFEPKDDLAFWIRGGTHGETEEDWDAFFQFLAAHFGAEHEP